MSTLPIITSNMSYYGSIFILVIGLFGCLCNLITFTAARLKCNPCAFYFLLSTIFEVCSITFGVISRMAADNLGSNLLSTSRAYCKLRAFLVSAIPLTATYLILMASIDRFMSSSASVRLRSFSQIKVAHRASILVTLIAWVSCSHILVSYDLRPRCATQPGSYAKFDGLFVVVWLGFIPHMSMLTFGVLTIINIRRKMRRLALIAPISGNANTGVQNRRETKTEKHLVWMMLVQVGVSSILIMTRMIYYAYSILTPSPTGYDLQVAIFLTSFTILLYYANYAKSFYIYTLSSRLFRTIFIERIQVFTTRLYSGTESNFPESQRH